MSNALAIARRWLSESQGSGPAHRENCICKMCQGDALARAVIDGADQHREQTRRDVWVWLRLQGQTNLSGWAKDGAFEGSYETHKDDLP